jgi:hypothetical protein
MYIHQSSIIIINNTDALAASLDSSCCLKRSLSAWMLVNCRRSWSISTGVIADVVTGDCGGGVGSAGAAYEVLGFLNEFITACTYHHSINPRITPSIYVMRTCNRCLPAGSLTNSRGVLPSYQIAHPQSNSCTQRHPLTTPTNIHICMCASSVRS